MKKLLTIASALLVAVVAQAATVTWEYELGEMIDDNDELISGVVLFYDGTTELGQANVVDGYAFFDDSGNSAIDVEEGHTVSAVLQMTFGGKVGTISLGDYVFTKPDSVPSWDNVFAMASGNFTEVVNNAPIDVAWTPQDAKNAGWDIEVVPEPTSVALLALGLAALGLKRKVA